MQQPCDTAGLNHRPADRYLPRGHPRASEVLSGLAHRLTRVDGVWADDARADAQHLRSSRPCCGAGVRARVLRSGATTAPSTSSATIMALSGPQCLTCMSNDVGPFLGPHTTALGAGSRRPGAAGRRGRRSGQAGRSGRSCRTPRRTNMIHGHGDVVRWSSRRRAGGAGGRVSSLQRGGRRAADAGPVIARRIDWPHSMGPLKKRLALIRPEYVGVDPVDRVVYQPGEITQCDLWFPESGDPVGNGQRWMLPCWCWCWASRFLSATMHARRSGTSGREWQVLGALGRGAEALGWDRGAAAGSPGADRRGDARGDLATTIRLATPRDRSSRGWSSATTGSSRPRSCPDAASPRRRTSTPSSPTGCPRANARTVRAIGGRPVDLLAADRAAMLALPPVAPAVGLRARVRLAREHVRWQYDYSVDPRVNGRSSTTPPRRPELPVICGGELVASHTRSWAKRAVITDPAHVEIAKLLRREHAARRDADHRLARYHGDGHAVDAGSPCPTTTLCSASTSPRSPVDRGLPGCQSTTEATPDDHATTSSVSARPACCRQLADRRGSCESPASDCWEQLPKDLEQTVEQGRQRGCGRQVADREAAGQHHADPHRALPAVKTLEEFNLDHLPSLRRDLLATGDRHLRRQGRERDSGGRPGQHLDDRQRSDRDPPPHQRCDRRVGCPAERAARGSLHRGGRGPTEDGIVLAHDLSRCLTGRTAGKRGRRRSRWLPPVHQRAPLSRSGRAIG